MRSTRGWWIIGLSMGLLQADLQSGLQATQQGQDRQITTYDHQQQRLVQIEEAPARPHVERRVRDGRHSLIIHHSAGQFILNSGFSTGSIVPEAQESLLQLYRGALDDLCRLVLGEER